MSNAQTIVQLLVLLSAAFPGVEVSKEKAEAYIFALADIDPMRLVNACHRYLMTGKTFPLPSDLRELATLDTNCI